MLERFVHAVSLIDAGEEDPAATRERVKDRFPRGATRRMTQLGLLVGSTLQELTPGPDDAVVYASAYAESRALEGFLESFPTASPTLFQTSIHPSAVQQALIGQQRPIREFFPMTGRAQLVGHAVQAAALCPAPRVLLCGGEERGTWLLERGVASNRSFAFSLALGATAEGAQARISLETTAEAPVPLLLPEFFDLLKARQSFRRVASPGLRLTFEWS